MLHFEADIFSLPIFFKFSLFTVNSFCGASFTANVVWGDENEKLLTFSGRSGVHELTVQSVVGLIITLHSQVKWIKCRMAHHQFAIKVYQGSTNTWTHFNFKFWSAHERCPAVDGFFVSYQMKNCSNRFFFDVYWVNMFSLFVL